MEASKNLDFPRKMKLRETVWKWKTFQETQSFEKGRKSNSSNMKSEKEVVSNNQEFQEHKSQKFQ